ncbi:alpha/beta hydrolase [Amycolatopsis sp. PS_44_ISF1]|uniref:alpha/beta hydrolase n=1 Tax=Amycolatopsis sp. PS_44_ISF1 TaxID=2974917 RepID=UPI0028DF94F8|nr:alpha/beta hydrolase [Amycolatopsis sp. PS_44_ISF1]MDT8912409.1 alpha/beta hydrolase [Amycolatopsis sp. PS_44_ISF1]
MSLPQRTAVDTLLRHAPIDFSGDVAEQRVVLDRVLTAQPRPADVVVTPLTLGDVPALAVEIDGQAPSGTVLYFHGGVFALGSAHASVGLTAELARRAGLRVVTVDYRLAPEHPYPAAPDDALSAYRALLELEGGPGSLAIAGESAGGNLAAVTLVNIRDAGLPLPSAGLLLSPWADLGVTGESVKSKAAVDPALTADALRVRARDYLRTTDPESPAASPIHADLRGLPPLLIQAGTHEILLDDAVRLAARAAADDVSVTLDVTAEVPHVFQAFAAMLDEGAAALDRAAAFLRDRLREPAAPAAAPQNP